jgi:hypothetical protein
MLSQSIGDAGTREVCSRLGVHHRPLPSARSRTTWGERRPPTTLHEMQRFTHSQIVDTNKHDHDRDQNRSTVASSVPSLRRLNTVSRLQTQLCRCQRSQLPASHADLQIRHNDKFSLFACYTARVLLQADALFNMGQVNITPIYATIAIHAAT